MDRSAVLARFVEVTGIDAGLARDLLAGKQWNWDLAIDDYIQLSGNLSSSNSTPAVPSSTGTSHTQHAVPSSSQTTAPKSAPVLARQSAINTKVVRQPVPGQKLIAPGLQQERVYPGRQPQQALPERQMVQPTSSMSNPGSANIGGSASSSSALPSSGGREREVRPHQAPQLTLFIPKPEEKERNAQRSPAPVKKLQRGISKANCALVDFSRQKVTEDEQDHNHYLVDTPMYTFILPDLALFPAEFRAFVEKDLLEMTTMANLEKAGRLNWWAANKVCSRLWPMATSGDGNCLLHAASLGMWGFHDRQLTLRKALYHALTENPRSQRMQKLKRRWRWQQTEINQKSGLMYSEKEWEEEWRGSLRLASAEPRTPISAGSKGSLPTLSEEKSPTLTDSREELTYQSLEEFHVFVLAHILRRPIIVVSDTMLRDAEGEAFAPIFFGGIYLPLEVPYRHCEAAPLVLTYDTAHFSALVPMEQDMVDYNHDGSTVLPVVIPVTDCDHRLLPVHFAVDPGPSFQWSINGKPNSQDKSLSTTDKVKLLHQYMNLVKIPSSSGAKRDNSSQPPARTSNGDSNGSGSPTDQLSFSKKLKYFAKLEKNKNGGSSSGNKNLPLSERKIGPITVADLDDPTIIVGSRMSEKRHQLQEEMIKNYIDKAKERFEEERQLKRLLKEENRQRQQQVTNSRLSPRNYDDSHDRGSEVYHEEPRAHAYNRQEPTHPNRRPSPEVQQHGPSPKLMTPSSVYQAPLTQTKSNPMPQSAVVQSRYHTPVVSSYTGPRPTSYQHGYQLDAPAEVTVLVNQTNVKPHQHQATRQQPRLDQSGAIGQLVQGVHQLQPMSVYQQTPSSHPVQQPPRSPQLARSAKVLSQTPQQPALGAPSSKAPSQAPGSRSPQMPRPSQVPPSPQPSKASSLAAKLTKSKDSKGAKNKYGDMGSRPCMSRDCDFYGTENTDFLCSRCYEAKIIKNPKFGRK